MSHYPQPEHPESAPPQWANPNSPRHIDSDDPTSNGDRATRPSPLWSLLLIAAGFAAGFVGGFIGALVTTFVTPVIMWRTNLARAYRKPSTKRTLVVIAVAAAYAGAAFANKVWLS